MQVTEKLQRCEKKYNLIGNISRIKEFLIIHESSDFLNVLRITCIPAAQLLTEKRARNEDIVLKFFKVPK